MRTIFWKIAGVMALNNSTPTVQEVALNGMVSGRGQRWKAAR
jgi:hypothetical protein